MSYEPTNWKAGDTVTSMKLNKMEQGIASSSAFIVHATASGNTFTLDKTWKEIHDAAQQEKYVCIIVHPIEAAVMNFPVIGVGSMDSRFIVQVINYDRELLVLATYETDSENGYPTMAVPVPGPDPGTGK